MHLCLKFVACGVAIAAANSSGRPRDRVPDLFLDPLLEPARWETGDFPGTWVPETSASRLCAKLLVHPPGTLGHQPQTVEALFQDGKCLQLAVVFLDAGNTLGFDPSRDLPKDPNDRDSLARSETEQSARNFSAQKSDFRQLYNTISRDMPKRLQAFSGTRGKARRIGAQNAIAVPMTEFVCGDFLLRLEDRRQQLIRLTILPAGSAGETFLDEKVAAMGKKPRAAAYKANVRHEENGDVFLDHVPVFPQGWRAYCAMSTFAMASQYIGVRLSPDQLAASAGFRYGQARSAGILDVYSAAAKEGGVDLLRMSKFEFGRAQKAIDDGFPAIVWRKFSPQRDYLHWIFVGRFAGDPQAALPEVTDEEIESWPHAPEDYSHASLVTGYNAARGEVIFSESWGEHARNRRMRHEEMTATSYKAFYFGW